MLGNPELIVAGASAGGGAAIVAGAAR